MGSMTVEVSGRDEIQMLAAKFKIQSVQQIACRVTEKPSKPKGENQLHYIRQTRSEAIREILLLDTLVTQFHLEQGRSQ